MRPDYMVGFDFPSMPYKFPKTRDFKDKAVMSDLVTHDTSISTGHRLGLNRVKMDGSVNWVSFTSQDRNGVTIKAHLLALKPSNSTAVKNAAVDGVFDALDRQ